MPPLEFIRRSACWPSAAPGLALQRLGHRNHSHRFLSFSAYLSSGCPDTKNPSTSFSLASRSPSSQSGTLGKSSAPPRPTLGLRRTARTAGLALRQSFCASAPAPSPCPPRPSAARACPSSPEPRLDQRLDHPLVHHSQVNLLAEFPNALESPPTSSRALRIDSIAFPPRSSPRQPNRIASPQPSHARKLAPGNLHVRRLHANAHLLALAIYFTTFSGFDVSEVSSAAINSPVMRLQ